MLELSKTEYSKVMNVISEIIEKDKRLQMNDTPQEGSLFITKEGHIVYGEEIHQEIVSKICIQLELDYKLFNFNSYDDVWSFIENTLGWIRCNSGTKSYEGHCYVALHNEYKPTNEQYKRIEDVLYFYEDTLKQDFVEVWILSEHNTRIIVGQDYRTIYNQSKDIVNKIKKYFSTGELTEKFNYRMSESSSQRDSLGNNLSKEQVEYFKKSKVRDAKGNLLVCYHGTSTPGFEEFSHQDKTIGNYKYDTRNINFFTSSKDVAKGYTEFGYEDSGNIYSVYLNIENPFVVNNQTTTDIKNWRTIKNDSLRKQQIDLFQRFWKKWCNNASEEKIDEINKDLQLLNCVLVQNEETLDDDYIGEIYYDLVKRDTVFSNKLYQYKIEELFEPDMKVEVRDLIVGNYDDLEDDYYLSTNDVISLVLDMNENNHTNYDGVIFTDISDVGPMGSIFDSNSDIYVTLKSANQIKFINNLSPTKASKLNEALLLEKSRNELIAKSKAGKAYSAKNQKKGKNRWERKKFSRVANATREFNSIDMNTFFKKDVLIVNIPVQGETDRYTVRIKFSGVLREIRDNVKRNNNKLDYRTISQALSKAFNSENISVFCTCKDWFNRFNWFSKQQDFNAGSPSQQAGWANQFEWTNKYDDMGGVCKHVALVISNLSWMMKVSSVINNYIHFAEENMQRQFADIIFPKIYGVTYPNAIQLGMFDRQYLKHSKGVIDAINEYGSKRGRFSKKQTQEVTQKEEQPVFTQKPKQLSIFDFEDENNEKSFQSQENIEEVEEEKFNPQEEERN